jgi:hypothetical protein
MENTNEIIHCQCCNMTSLLFTNIVVILSFFVTYKTFFCIDKFAFSFISDTQTINTDSYLIWFCFVCYISIMSSLGGLLVCKYYFGWSKILYKNTKSIIKLIIGL